MTDDLSDGSEVVDFQEVSLTKDGLVSKRNTKLHANLLEILLLSA